MGCEMMEGGTEGDEASSGGCCSDNEEKTQSPMRERPSHRDGYGLDQVRRVKIGRIDGATKLGDGDGSSCCSSPARQNDEDSGSKAFMLAKSWEIELKVLERLGSRKAISKFKGRQTGEVKEVGISNLAANCLPTPDESDLEAEARSETRSKMDGNGPKRSEAKGLSTTVGHLAANNGTLVTSLPDSDLSSSGLSEVGADYSGDMSILGVTSEVGLDISRPETLNPKVTDQVGIGEAVMGVSKTVINSRTATPSQLDRSSGDGGPPAALGVVAIEGGSLGYGRGSRREGCGDSGLVGGVDDQKDSKQPVVSQQALESSKRSRAHRERTRLEDESLVNLALAGDREAYRKLVEKYQARLFFCAHEILKNREDAEDVVQEALVKAYFSLSSFKRESSFYTWLYRIVVNLSIDLRRRLGRRGAEILDELDEGKIVSALTDTISDAPSDIVFRKQQIAMLSRALTELTEEQREVVTLREFDGLSYNEIAEALQISIGTVMSRLHYARKKIQLMFDEWDRETKEIAAGS